MGGFMGGFTNAQDFLPVSNQYNNNNNNYQSFMQGMSTNIPGYSSLIPNLLPKLNSNINLGTSLPTSGLNTYNIGANAIDTNGAGLKGTVFDLNPAQVSGLNTADTAVNSNGFFSSMFDRIDPKTHQKIGGWGGTALNLANSAGNMYLGLKNLGVAEDTLKFQKNAFSKQFDAQRQTINTHLADRQRARLSAASGDTSHTLSVEDYMRQNAV